MIAKVAHFTEKIFEWGKELVEAGAKAAEFRGGPWNLLGDDRWC